MRKLTDENYSTVGKIVLKCIVIVQLVLAMFAILLCISLVLSNTSNVMDVKLIIILLGFLAVSVLGYISFFVGEIFNA